MQNYPLVVNKLLTNFKLRLVYHRIICIYSGERGVCSDENTWGARLRSLYPALRLQPIFFQLVSQSHYQVPQAG